MSFQINALRESLFNELFALSDIELANRSARRIVADVNCGYPCRVSLFDAEIGETVILLNYEHHAHDTLYRSCHAIFVQQGAKQAVLKPGEVPEALSSRLLSVRAFDCTHDMVAAKVVDGLQVESTIGDLFADPKVEYLHLHNAKPGCFAASVTRV